MAHISVTPFPARLGACRRGKKDWARGAAGDSHGHERARRKPLPPAGLEPSDADGMLSYSFNDSTFSTDVAGDLGIRLNFYMDVYGGGSSTEALIGIAIGVLAAGMCQTVVVYRAMNGYSQLRIGGTGRSPSAIGGS